MQDEVNAKTIALSVNMAKTGMHMTADVLKAAMRKHLQSRERKKSSRAMQKAQEKNRPVHGKQTVAELMKQNQGLTNIEITDDNIRSFEKIANKYNIDFALKKDVTAELPKYIVFFKARDVDVMTQAFKEYSAKTIVKAKKPSIRSLLSKAVEKSKILEGEQDKNRQREKNRNRGREL